VVSRQSKLKTDRRLTEEGPPAAAGSFSVELSVVRYYDPFVHMNYVNPPFRWVSSMRNTPLRYDSSDLFSSCKGGG